MSYILFFWREHPAARINARNLVEVLDDGASYRGLECMPFHEVRSAFRKEFPEVRDVGLSLDWEHYDSRFEAVPMFKGGGLVSLMQVYCTKCGITVERVRAIAAALGCRVYDPQWEEAVQRLGMPRAGF